VTPRESVEAVSDARAHGKVIHMFSGLESPTYLLLVFLVVVLLFGAKRLPEIGRDLSSGIHGFKQALINPEDARPEIDR
jgi:sec-independent protein translocase protein TatA